MVSSEKMTSFIVKMDDIQRLDSIIETLWHNGMNLNQGELFSKLLDLGENYLKELNLRVVSPDGSDTILKTELTDQQDLTLNSDFVCKTCETKANPPTHCKRPMQLEELNGTREWVCWMGRGCGHKAFDKCCESPSFSFNNEIKTIKVTELKDEFFEIDDAIIEIVISKPGTSSKWHHHGQYLVLNYMLSGRKEFSFGPNGEKSIIAKQGDLIHVPKGLIHKEAVPEGEEAKYLLIRVGTGNSLFVVNSPG